MKDDIRTVPIDTYGTILGKTLTKKCAYCGEKFSFKRGQVIYLYSGLQFCSWNCKQKYRKMHPDPNEEMTYAEKIELLFFKKEAKKEKKKEGK